MGNLGQDLRYAWRTLIKSPIFTTIAILSLALGIGANTAIFTVLDQLLLRFLPVKDPEALVQVSTRGSHYGSNRGRDMLSFPMFHDFRGKNQVFEDMFCRRMVDMTLTLDGQSERVDGEIVSGSYFQVLGVGAAAGRLFTPEEDQKPRTHPVAVLSYDYWQSRFNLDPGIIGKKILVNNYPMTVIGISAAGFEGISPGVSPKIRVPTMMKVAINEGYEKLDDRRSRWVQAFGRKKPGVSDEQVAANLQTVLSQTLQMEVQMEAFSKATKYTRDQFVKTKVFLQPGARGASELRRQLEKPLLVLMAMVGVVLLIACANLAGLLIARANARTKEIAVRLSMGATRARIVRLLLVESCLLSFVGAVASVILSGLAVRGLLSFLPAAEDGLMLKVAPDWRILLFNFGVAMFAGVAFGLAPALQTTRPDLATTLKDQAGAVVGAGSIRLRKMLVVAQVALSLILLIGAGLFVRSLQNLRKVNPGFQLDNLISFQVDPSLSGYKNEKAFQFYQQLQRRLEAIPGVQAAGLAMVPILNGGEWDSSITIEGYQAKDGEPMGPHVNSITPGYLKTMGLKLLAGRDFDERDTKNSQKVVMINQKMAKHFFGDRDAVGRHIGWGSDPGTKTDIEIVGVVSDSRYESFRDEIPWLVYRGYNQDAWSTGMVGYARTTLPPDQMFGVIRRTIHDLDPNLPLYSLRTLEKQLDYSLANERLVALLSTIFGFLATGLALLGLYGVMAYTVNRRTREIGIRMALGAESGRVVWMIMREVVVMVGIGLALALPAAYWCSKLVQSQLYGIEAQDPMTLGGSVLLLAAVALLAGYIPAWRAARIDPMRALRYE